jgi:hypothetical protein
VGVRHGRVGTASFEVEVGDFLVGRRSRNFDELIDQRILASSIGLLAILVEVEADLLGRTTSCQRGVVHLVGKLAARRNPRPIPLGCDRSMPTVHSRRPSRQASMPCASGRDDARQDVVHPGAADFILSLQPFAFGERVRVVGYW